VRRRHGERILVSTDNGVDPGVVLDCLRRSWGILVRRDAAAPGVRLVQLAREGRP
jgi:hypothetical protein